MGNFKIIGLLACILLWGSCAKDGQGGINADTLWVRVAKVEVLHEYLGEYLDILKEEAAASIKLEPGVICIFPMQDRGDSTKIQLLEIYRDQEAYQAHLRTPHFLKYKNGTLHMVKSLELVDMRAVDPSTMPGIFLKLSP